jgi:predicted Holliday junction resolvase-like endonuclease
VSSLLIALQEYAHARARPSHGDVGHDERMQLHCHRIADHYRAHPEERRLDRRHENTKEAARKLREWEKARARQAREQAARELNAWTYGRAS